MAVPFSIVPDPGYVIDKVFVDDYPNSLALSGSYTFTNLIANHTIYATFKPITYTITATAGPYGSTMPAGAVQVLQGADQLIQILPNPGYHVNDVTVDGISVGAVDSYLFTNVMASHTIHATFAINTYTITPSAGGNGNISPNTPQTVNYGANKTFTFTPATGYKVHEVFIDGTPDIAAALAGTYTFFNVSADHTIDVTFTKQTYTITSTAGPNGTIWPLGVDYVEYMEHSQIYAFEPADGYYIKEVYVDGEKDPLALYNQMHRFLNVDANHTIHVFFAKIEFTIVATATSGGTINPSGMITVPNGGTKQFFFNPDAGNKLARVFVDGIEQPQSVVDAGTYIFTDMDDDHTITAQFEKSGCEVFLPTLTGADVIPVNGSISPVAYGGKFEFEVRLLEGYTQSNIIVRSNGIVLNADALGIYTIKNIIIDQTVTIERLVLNTYKVKAEAYPGGVITPAGTFMVTHGDSKTFNIVANPKYVIEDVKINGESEGAVDKLTLEEITGDLTVTAYFKWSVGIDENSASIVVFSHRNVVTIVNESLVPVKQVEIMDMYGRLVWTGVPTGTETNITLDVANGIYAVRMVTESNDVATTKVSITK